jgi:hypothetical protein
MGSFMPTNAQPRSPPDFWSRGSLRNCNLSCCLYCRHSTVEPQQQQLSYGCTVLRKAAQPCKHAGGPVGLDTQCSTTRTNGSARLTAAQYCSVHCAKDTCSARPHCPNSMLFAMLPTDVYSRYSSATPTRHQAPLAASHCRRSAPTHATRHCYMPTVHPMSAPTLPLSLGRWSTPAGHQQQGWWAAVHAAGARWNM